MLSGFGINLLHSFPRPANSTTHHIRLVAELKLELADSEINTDEVGRKEDRYDSDDARASDLEGL